MELPLVLENLKDRFDHRRFKPSATSKRRHSGIRDAFFETTFQQMFVETGRSGRDDLLFYVRHDETADKDTVEVLRRDSKTLPSSEDPLMLWDKTLYLNLILHEFDYHVTCSVITLKPGSDSISSVKKTVKLKVFPSPTERRMDKKGGGNHVIYPDIMFCVDGFEEIFNKITLTLPGEKVAVQLVAVNKSCRISRMVFLGAVDYVALKAECMKRDQNSLTRHFKRLSLTRHSSDGKRNDLNRTYSFLKMHGPKMKGFAEMAVARAKHDLAPPHPAPVARGQLTKPTISPQLVVAAKPHGSQVAPKSTPQIVVIEGEDSNSSTPSPVHLRMSPSPPASTPLHVRSYSSPVDTASSAGSRGDLDEAYHSTAASPSYSSVMEAEDFRRRSRPVSGILSRQDSRDSFLSNDSMLYDHNDRSQSFTGHVRDNDTISVGSSTTTASTASGKERFKLGLGGRSRSKSGSDVSFPVSAYLTYITLPWYCIVDDILNSTRKRVL